MLSKVLIALYAAMPGRPNSTPQSKGATTPSAKFSAVNSIAARATPCASRLAGSRPTMCSHGAATLVRVLAPDRLPPLRRARTARAPRSGCSWPARATTQPSGDRAHSSCTARATAALSPITSRLVISPRRAWSAAGVAGSSQRASSRAMIQPIADHRMLRGAARAISGHRTGHRQPWQAAARRAAGLGPSAAWQAAAPLRLWRRTTGIAIQGGTGDG